MSDGPIRAVVYGVGAMGRQLVPLLLDKGVEIVGAIAKEDVGSDLGTVCGMNKPLGVTISSDAAAALAAARPVDVALLAVTTYLRDMVPHITACIDAQANVITTSEEAFYPWHTSPTIAQELHDMARDAGVTVVGSGFQDIFWANQVIQLSGTCHRIDEVRGLTQCNVDDYGPEVARDHYVGLTIEEFEAQLETEGRRPSYFQMVGPLICEGLGLQLTSLEEVVRPAIAAQDMACRALGTIVPSGAVIGKVHETLIDTEEGVHFRIELAEKVYGEGDVDLNQWAILGHPDVFVSNDKPATDVITCTTLVNRIPDVINAAPGFLSVDDLPKLRYRPASLDAYVQRAGKGQ